jgi:hypothetical protein
VGQILALLLGDPGLAATMASVTDKPDSPEAVLRMLFARVGVSGGGFDPADVTQALVELTEVVTPAT